MAVRPILSVDDKNKQNWLLLFPCQSTRSQKYDRFSSARSLIFDYVTTLIPDIQQNHNSPLL